MSITLKGGLIGLLLFIAVPLLLATGMVQLDARPAKTVVVRSIHLPNLGRDSDRRVWDFAVKDHLIYYLVASSAFSAEVIVTDTNGSIRRRFAVARPKRTSSGKITVSTNGVVGVLLCRSGEGAALLVFTGDGGLLSDTALDRHIVDLRFWGSSLIGAAWDGLLSLNMFKGEAMGESLSIKQSFPSQFVLLPASNRLEVFELLDDRWTQWHDGVKEVIPTDQTPELNERSREMRDDGVVAIGDATTDGDGNVYMMLLNLKASPVFRVLKINENGQRLDLLQVLLEQNAETGRYLYPRLIRVDKGEICFLLPHPINCR